MFSFFISARYFFGSLSAIYLRSFLRFPTICNRPRRAAKSFLLTLRCSVSSAIRAVRIPTCASGDPVFFLSLASSAIIDCFLSEVIIRCPALYHTLICFSRVLQCPLPPEPRLCRCIYHRSGFSLRLSDALQCQVFRRYPALRTGYMCRKILSR